MKKRSRSSEHIGVGTQKRIESGRIIMNNSSLKSNMSKVKHNPESRESMAGSHHEIHSINMRSMNNLHNVHGLNHNELRTMQSTQDAYNEEGGDWYKNKVIRDFIRQDK